MESNEEKVTKVICHMPISLAMLVFGGRMSIANAQSTAY